MHKIVFKKRRKKIFQIDFKNRCQKEIEDFKKVIKSLEEDFKKVIKSLEDIKGIEKEIKKIEKQIKEFIKQIKMRESEIKRCKEEIKEDEDMLQKAFEKWIPFQKKLDIQSWKLVDRMKSAIQMNIHQETENVLFLMIL